MELSRTFPGICRWWWVNIDKVSIDWKLSNRFQDELIVLSCTGYANIVTFHNNTTVFQKLIKEDDKFDITQSIKNIAK